MPAQPDYYEILQVHPAAEPEVIQAAYRRLSLKYHPDVYHGADAQQRMARLNEAYAVLSDDLRRAVYDRQRFKGRKGVGAQVSPLLQVQPKEVNLGALALGRTRTASIHVTNEGLGQLSGMVISHVPWLQVTPAEFAGNDLDVVLRFQPTVPGEFQAIQALEIYSNGGRATIAVRGSVRSGSTQATETSPPSPSFKGRPVAHRSPTQMTRSPWNRVQVPFMAWVWLGTLVSGVIWFQIAPLFAVVPLGLGFWLTWERVLGRRAPAPSQESGPRRSPRSKALGRCLVCSSAFDPSKARKCTRCGGSICLACGACPCQGPGARRPH